MGSAWMKLVGRQKLEDFGRVHADIRTPLDVWQREVEEAAWRTPIEIKARYAQASFVGEGRVIFNLKGNKYRVDTKISFNNQVMVVVRIGTHHEYDSWKF